ncbi:MAG: DUF2852 domain-containing protein [Granulosicoccus sp.]
MSDLRSQLAPGWSGVNIGLLVVLFLMGWPLGLIMLGYIIWGNQLGLHLGRPETMTAAFSRLGYAWKAGLNNWRNKNDSSTGTPDYKTGHSVDNSAEQLHKERLDLEKDRLAFEAEKRVWKERNETVK